MRSVVLHPGSQPPDASVSRMCRAQTLPPQVSATIMPWMMRFDAFSNHTKRKIAVSAKLPAETITKEGCARMWSRPSRAISPTASVWPRLRKGIIRPPTLPLHLDNLTKARSTTVNMS